MRLFNNLEEAHGEIKRDISKSPRFSSRQVQGIVATQEVHEAMNYSYTIEELPMGDTEIADLAVGWGVVTPDERASYQDWLQTEARARVNWRPNLQTESINPRLRGVVQEGKAADYLYTDRLRGATDALANMIFRDPSTRRAYWPIFQPEDALRGARSTRIPCSLGYQVMIREVDDLPFLHLTYLQRSCDFDRFWLSDLWFARQFQKDILSKLSIAIEDARMGLGHLTHIILSLHSFIGEEIY